MFPKNLKDSIDPDGDMGFKNLEELLLDGCNLSDVEFLKSSYSFPKLKYLRLPSNEFTHLIKYDSWKGLFVHECKQLQDSSSLSSDCLEVDLLSCCKSKGGIVADESSLKKVPKTTIGRVFLSGREMPQWILPCDEGFIYFKVPRDLYDKLLGLAICVVPGSEEGEMFNGEFDFQIFVNGRRLFKYCADPVEWKFDGVWLCYVPRRSLNGVEKLMPNKWGHFQVCFIKTSKVSVKKCGFRLVCEQQEDDLRVCTTTPSADAKQIRNSKKETQEKKQFSEDSEDSPMKQDSTKKMRQSQQGKTMGFPLAPAMITGVVFQNTRAELVPTC